MIKTHSLKAHSKVFLVLPILFFMLILTNFASSTITTTLNSPADGTLFYTNPITFNVTGVTTSPNYLMNMSLYDNSTGNWGLRNTTTGLNNLISYYTLDNTVMDLIGNNNGVDYGTENVSGKINYGRDFENTDNDNITIGSNTIDLT